MVTSLLLYFFAPSLSSLANHLCCGSCVPVKNSFVAAKVKETSLPLPLTLLGSHSLSQVLNKLYIQRTNHQFQIQEFFKKNAKFVTSLLPLYSLLPPRLRRCSLSLSLSHVCVYVKTVEAFKPGLFFTKTFTRLFSIASRSTSSVKYSSFERTLPPVYVCLQMEFNS